MVMTDPVADMLTRIRNANMSYRDDLEMPASTIKARVADILTREGYVEGYDVQGEGIQKAIRVRMKYGPNRERTITGIRRVSKPGKRVYVGHDEIPRVLGGLGISILSTSRGVMGDTEARKQNVGGELICTVY